MKLDHLHILARIALLPSNEGGRRMILRGPVSYRPNHNFFGENDREMCMGSIQLSEGQTLAPGEAMEIEMTLFTWPELTKQVDIGRRWRLQEGAQLVGWGTVLTWL